MKRLFDDLVPGTAGVKMCGITTAADAALCIGAGATALGFNFYQGSKRFLTLEKERPWLEQVPDSVLRVAVMVNPSLPEALTLLREPYLDAIQLHGDETPNFCRVIGFHSGKSVIKALRVENEAALGQLEQFRFIPVLLDAYAAQERGGTGHSFDWTWLDAVDHPEIILAGGLTSQNVEAALRITKVRYVDVASGIEDHPRQKNPEKVQAFISEVRKRVKSR